MGLDLNEISTDSLSKRVYSKYSNTAVDTNMNADDTSSYLDFDGYLKLLTAQMSNQDFNDAMSDSEFIQQMSSYSMMQAISELTKQNAISYSSSLIGKAVTVTDASGVPDTGIVEAVTVSGGECKILVNGNQYSTDKISDVVDGDVFTKLNSLVGHNVAVKNGDDEITGKVTAIYIKEGNGFVTINNKNVYALNDVKGIIDDDDPDDDGTKKDNEEAGTASVNEENAAYSHASAEEDGGVVTRSSEALDSLIGVLESGSDYAASATVSSSITEGSAEVDEVAAASGLVSGGSDYDYSGRSSSRIPAPYGSSYADTVSSAAAYSKSYDNGFTEGVVSVASSDAASRTLTSYMGAGASSVYTSVRKYADKYPVEAAFADSTGTHMADIRFIGNTAICDRIDTSELLCYSQKGKPVTDIGWCGKGRLGEVVTFADGTQRVEIIGPRSVSYYTTSGNFTINEMLNEDVPPGYFKDKLTPFEVAIIHYGREYTPEEQAEMERFGAYAAANAAALMRNANNSIF